ncbi:ASCH domain-containing protein [Arenibacter sp. GZD96]|uniref:ASCH domain-containing protein n=1 Tax=Aurantibrevibacter litoralis TaxID=3106030 RepID=UPI002AFE51FB|nr:ASCH domain-containing protein [Arenibacter sp. GZD-96]MEA1784646.1 ASCH domain-containing protein [Arenibacter sp. GZD-96]
MKQFTIIFFLVFISCKNVSKIESRVDKTVYEMWNNYTKSNPEFKNSEIPESWYFHTNREDANRLAALTVNGKKKAASGLYAWYKEANADLPKIGTKHIITDFDGKAQAIIEIKKVDTIPFNKISKDYAELDMGTTKEALKKWKKAHWDFFESTLGESNSKPTEEMLVVCERFEKIWPKLKL